MRIWALVVCVPGCTLSSQRFYGSLGMVSSAPVPFNKRMSSRTRSTGFRYLRTWDVVSTVHDTRRLKLRLLLQCALGRTHTCLERNMFVEDHRSSTNGCLSSVFSGTALWSCVCIALCMLSSVPLGSKVWAKFKPTVYQAVPQRLTPSPVSCGAEMGMCFGKPPGMGGGGLGGPMGGGGLGGPMGGGALGGGMLGGMMGGRPQYGQPGYGQPQYGQQGYGQPPYGQQGAGGLPFPNTEDCTVRMILSHSVSIRASGGPERAPRCVDWLVPSHTKSPSLPL